MAAVRSAAGEFLGVIVHSPKTPPAFALRIVPTLPEAELKAIARRAATNMALKRLQGGSRPVRSRWR